MRRSRSSCSSALALVVALTSGGAWAQACCAGASILSPTRLTPHEDASVALLVSGGLGLGSLDGRGRFLGNPAGVGELDLSQSLVGSLRVLREGQLALSVPAVETLRRVPGLSEAGGMLGDVALSFRYDFLLAGESLRVPGLAVLAGVTLPTGRAADQARLPLSSDATGAGQWQGALGVAAEQAWGPVYAQANLVVQQGLPRRALGVTETLGTTFSLAASVGWAFDEGGAVALVASASTSLPAWLDGVATAGTQRTRSSLGIGGAWPLTDTWRVQGSLVSWLPLGVNEPVSTTLTVLLVRSWS